MMDFDWEQEAYKRLHQLERENADLRRENARLLEYMKELELETVRIAFYRNRFKRAARALTVH